MHSGKARKEDVVAEDAVTAECGAIGEDRLATYAAIVRDMTARHEESTVSDRRLASALNGATVHRHAFADCAVGPNR